MEQHQPKRVVRGEIIGKCRACGTGQVDAYGDICACDHCDFVFMRHSLSHLGVPEITIDEMTKLLNDEFPWIFGMINARGEEYGGYGYLAIYRGRWAVRFNWTAPQRPDLQETHQPVRARRATAAATSSIEDTDNSSEKEG